MTRSPSPAKHQENAAPENSPTKSPCSPLMQRQDATCYTPELLELTATNSPLQMTAFIQRSPTPPAAARPHAPSPKAGSRSPTPEEDRVLREAQKKFEEARSNAQAAKERREAEARKRQAATRWSAFAVKALKHDQKLTMTEAGLAAIERKKLKDERVEAERKTKEEADRKARESRSPRFLPGKKQEKVSTGCDCLFSFSRK